MASFRLTVSLCPLHVSFQRLPSFRSSSVQGWFSRLAVPSPTLHGFRPMRVPSPSLLAVSGSLSLSCDRFRSPDPVRLGRLSFRSAPHSTRLTTAETAINSCATFELSTEVDSSPVITPAISHRGSRLSPPKGPRRQLGVGSAEAFPITLQERQAPLRGIRLINVSEYWGCLQPKTLAQTIISTGD